MPKSVDRNNRVAEAGHWSEDSEPGFPDFALGEDDVHIWHAGLDASTAELSELSEVLSPDEKHRAEKLHFEIDRRRFVICRGILRSILGKYIGMDPVRLQFRYGGDGKPEISDQPSQATVRFNTSHSHGMAVFAFARCREVGVDVEKVRDVPDMEQIARRFFTAAEFDGICSLPESEKKMAFFRCWTRKEAVVKATGDGLTMPMDSFTVSLDPGVPPEVLKIRGDKVESASLCIRDIGLDLPYIGAFAVEDDGRRSNHWQRFEYREKLS